MQYLKQVFRIVFFGILIQQFGLIDATNHKQNLCEAFERDQPKMPLKYQPLYNRIHNLCQDPNTTREEVLTHFKNSMTEDDRTEIQAYQIGKEGLCNYFSNLSSFWPKIGDNQVLTEEVNDPEYRDVLAICQDTSKTIEDLIPAIIAFTRLYILFPKKLK